MQSSSAAAGLTPVVRFLPQLADYSARQYGAAPFVSGWSPEGWRSRSYQQFALDVHAFARLLAECGIGPGARVGLQSENRPEWGVAYLAVLEAGAAVVPLDAQLTPQEVGEILYTAGAAWCVSSRRQRSVIEEAKTRRLPRLQLLSLDEEADLPNLPASRTRFPNATALPEHGAPDDLAVLIFTSGTTGQAKGVMLSHANILHNVEGVARSFGFGPGDRLLSVLPLHHTFECTAGFLLPLRIGAGVAYARGLKSNELREDLQTSDATIMVGVPLLYEKLLAAIHRGIDAAPRARRWLVKTLLATTRLARAATGLRLGGRLLRPVRERAGMGRLRVFACGAAALPEEVFWGFVDLGWPVLEGYGLTECAPVVAANRPERPRPGAVGWPLMGVEVRIEDPDGEGNGEIVVRGPNVMLGYFGNPSATADVVREGWFHTGDLGRFLADGRLRITGRLKNMIATAAGKKIYPEEVEARLANSPYVLEVVVVGGRDARGEREEVHAHVFPDFRQLETLALAHGATCDEAFVDRTLRHEIETRCQELAPYKRVKRVIVRREEFPKTTTGKIRRLGLTDAEATRRSAVA